jgi:hypothetical protein
MRASPYVETVPNRWTRLIARVNTRSLLTSLAFATLVVGCATTPPQPAPEKKPRKAARVEVLMYDSATRPATAHLDVYDKTPPERPHRVTALLTCEGAVDQEVVMTAAIFYRARQIGADAVIKLETIYTQPKDPAILAGSVFGSGTGTRCVFQYRAIVYENK